MTPEEIVKKIEDMTREYRAPLNETPSEPVVFRAADGTPILECTSSHRGEFRQPIVVILSTHYMLHRAVFDAVKSSGFEVVLVRDHNEAVQAAREFGLDEFQLEAKLTGLANELRGDPAFSYAREDLCAMPRKNEGPGRKSQRPALPKNRKRDRWN